MHLCPCFIIPGYPLLLLLQGNKRERAISFVGTFYVMYTHIGWGVSDGMSGPLPHRLLHHPSPEMPLMSALPPRRAARRPFRMRKFFFFFWLGFLISRYVGQRGWGSGQEVSGFRLAHLIPQTTAKQLHYSQYIETKDTWREKINTQLKHF